MEIKIAAMIKKLRENNNLSQDELGDKLSISGKTISSWEKERSQPRMGQVREMANIFNVSIDYMISGSEDSLKNSDLHNILNRIKKLDTEQLSDLIKYLDFIESKQ